MQITFSCGIHYIKSIFRHNEIKLKFSFLCVTGLLDILRLIEELRNVWYYKSILCRKVHVIKWSKIIIKGNTMTQYQYLCSNLILTIYWKILLNILGSLSILYVNDFTCYCQMTILIRQKDILFLRMSVRN